MHKPKIMDSSSIKNYEEFYEKVKFILFTVNQAEFDAATTYITAPNNENCHSNRSVATKLESPPRTYVGTFAGHPVGLIKTHPGRNCEDGLISAIKVFPNVKFIVGIGVCYGFNKKKNTFWRCVDL